MKLKRLTALIRSYKLDEVKMALVKTGIFGMTVSEVRGFGRQRGHIETYRGAEYQIDFVNKLSLDVIVPEEKLQSAIDAVVGSARTGEIGDGKIFISEIEDVIRIRTGETGLQAL